MHTHCPTSWQKSESVVILGAQISGGVMMKIKLPSTWRMQIFLEQPSVIKAMDSHLHIFSTKA